MFPGVRSSPLFSGFGLNPLLLVFSLIFTIASRLLRLYSTIDKTSLSKTMGCFSGCLMSFAGSQLFCGISSVFKCSFDEFVGEKVVSSSYSSAILGPAPPGSFLMSQLFKLGGRSIGALASASVFPMNIQGPLISFRIDWFDLAV